LTAEQRTLYDAFEKMTLDEEYQGFEVRNAEGAFTGPWGVMLHFPDLAVPLGQFINLAQKLPGLSERARQVVILTIGGRFNVAYELYAHAQLATRAGLRSDQVAALSAGSRPADLSEDEVLAADVAAALTRAGAVPGPLYDTAVARLGRPGFDAVVFIVIHYLALGTLLNAYNVPAGRPVAQTA
jgi:4-carboxymuconolactone decarboxylase